jgi:hypothetical protein
MKFTPDYTLTLKSGEQIPLLYNTWAFRTYSARKGIEYEDLVAGCFPQRNEQGEAIGAGETLKTNNLPDLLLIGAECYAKYNNAAFTYNDLDACLWMDDLGGLYSSELAELAKIFVGKLLNIDTSNLQTEAKQEPPKKKGKAAKR